MTKVTTAVPRMAAARVAPRRAAGRSETLPRAGIRQRACVVCSRRPSPPRAAQAGAEVVERLEQLAKPDVTMVLPPPGVYKAAVSMSATKASYSPGKTLALGALAGGLIGIGALLMSFVAAGSPQLAAANPSLAAVVKGAVGLPFGLSMVILTGAELFTGNVFVMTAGLLAKQVTTAQLLKNWALSFTGNLAGSVAVASMVAAAGTMAAPHLAAGAAGLAASKVAPSFATLAVRGVLCNWLVCLAVWMAMASKTVSGKIMSCLVPITTFVALGFEHSIANMYLIPQGMFAGAEVSTKQFLMGNLLPVTVGNILGGAVFVALAHHYAYGE